MNSYPQWRMTWSNEDIDRAQQLARRLTQRDRDRGRPAPPHGYSARRIEQATRAVRRHQV